MTPPQHSLPAPRGARTPARPGHRLFLPDPGAYQRYGRRHDDRVFVVGEGSGRDLPPVEVGLRLGPGGVRA